MSWQLPTTVEALTLLGALSRLGARQNPLIPVLGDGEMRSILEDVAPDLLIVPRAWRGHDHETMAADLVAAHGCRLWVLPLDSDVASLGIDDVSTHPGAPSADAGRWVYTSSGSTGRPKTFVHSDASVIASARAQSLQLDLGPTDVFPVSFPVAHIGGEAWLVTSWRRGTQLLLDSAFDPSSSPERMARHGATILGSATPFFVAFLEKQRQLGVDRLFPDLRFCMGGGAPIPAGLHDQVIRGRLQRIRPHRVPDPGLSDAGEPGGTRRRLGVRPCSGRRRRDPRRRGDPAGRRRPRRALGPGAPVIRRLPRPRHDGLHG